ncbi:MAG: hypothetical protein KKD44_27850 [Proteobacteria bacterium]|nr:hypothetical protein [Pseudomonadota bacterium]
MGEKSFQQEFNQFPNMIQAWMKMDLTIEEIEFARKALLTIDTELVDRISDLRERKEAKQVIIKHTQTRKQRRCPDRRPLCHFKGSCKYQTHKRTRTVKKLSKEWHCTSHNPCNQKNGLD